MYSISLVVVVVLTAGVVSSQSDCPSITEATLESVITKYVPSGGHRETPTVDVLNFRPVCLAYSQERDRYRYVSVVVQYTCTGNANCPSGTAVEQFESECDSGTWSHNVQGDTDNTRTENPTATLSTTAREDCAFCFSPGTASGFSGITTDPVTHCVECHSSCDEGLMRCYGLQDSQCCQYYNDSTCVDTCPSPRIPDDEYNCVCPSGYTGVNCSPIVDCGDPPPLESATFSFKSGTVVGSSVTYVCGEVCSIRQRTCLATGNWSNDDIRCSTVPSDASSMVSMISETVTTAMETMVTPTDVSKPINSSNTNSSCDSSVLLVVSAVLVVLVILLATALVVALIVVYRLHSSNRKNVFGTIPVDENVAYSELQMEAKASESEVVSSPQYEEVAAAMKK